MNSSSSEDDSTVYLAEDTPMAFGNIIPNAPLLPLNEYLTSSNLGTIRESETSHLIPETETRYLLAILYHFLALTNTIPGAVTYIISPAYFAKHMDWTAQSVFELEPELKWPLLALIIAVNIPIAISNQISFAERIKQFFSDSKTITCKTDGCSESFLKILSGISSIIKAAISSSSLWALLYTICKYISTEHQVPITIVTGIITAICFIPNAAGQLINYIEPLIGSLEWTLPKWMINTMGWMVAINYGALYLNNFNKVFLPFIKEDLTHFSDGFEKAGLIFNCTMSLLFTVDTGMTYTEKLNRTLTQDPYDEESGEDNDELPTHCLSLYKRIYTTGLTTSVWKAIGQCMALLLTLYLFSPLDIPAELWITAAFLPFNLLTQVSFSSYTDKELQGQNRSRLFRHPLPTLPTSLRCCASRDYQNPGEQRVAEIEDGVSSDDTILIFGDNSNDSLGVGHIQH